MYAFLHIFPPTHDQTSMLLLLDEKGNILFKKTIDE